VLNRGRHLFSAGRPSRWALAHTSSCVRFSFSIPSQETVLGNIPEMTYFVFCVEWDVKPQLNQITTVSSVYGAVTMIITIVPIWWMHTHCQAATNLRPSQPTSAVSLPIMAASVYMYCHLLLLLIPSQAGVLSWSLQCSVPKGQGTVALMMKQLLIVGFDRASFSALTLLVGSFDPQKPSPKWPIMCLVGR